MSGDTPESRPFAGTARYRVLRRLGQGGMGVVYEALDVERDMRVALKTMRHVDPHLLLRFKQEFRALQGLEHPNLVALFDLVGDNDQLFFTMELVEGQGFLRHVRKDAPRPPAEAEESTDPTVQQLGETVPLDGRARAVAPEPPEPVPYDEGRLRAALIELAAGLAHLHAAGKVHRDVKPSNVMVTPAGRVVLLDFGLVFDQDADRLESAIVGTPEYMAPEQALHRPVGPAADCYAVGVMLYETLTGRLPYRGSGVEIMQAKQSRAAPAPLARVRCAEDLSALTVDLLQRDPAARPTAVEIMRRLGVDGRAASRRSSAGGAGFVGREAELGRLGAAFEHARRGQLALVLLDGPSGVGKSALVRHFARRLEASVQDMVVLAGRYYEREALPYRALDAVMDALARHLMSLSDDAASALLPVDVGLVASLFPSLRAVECVSRLGFTSPARDPQELRSRLHHAVRDLCVRLGRQRPLLLVLDDIQWSDADSRAVMVDVLRPPESPQLLVVATLRTGADPEAAVAQTLALMSPMGRVERITLGPLEGDEARALAGRLLGDRRDGRAAAIAGEAQGHPLLIDVLARHALRGGAAPSSVRLEDALEAEIAALDPDAAALLELLALAGQPLPERLAQRALGVELPALARAIAALRAGHLVRSTRRRGDDALEPYHDRVREAAARRLDEAGQRRRHQQLARTFEAEGNVAAEALFAHWRRAGDVARSIPHGLLAAARASEVLAFDRAAHLYRELIGLVSSDDERRRLRVKLGEVLANAGRGADAAAAYQQAIPGAAEAEALDLNRRAAEQLLRSGRIAAGLAAIRDELAAVGLEMPRTPRRALLLTVVRRALLAVRGHRWRPRDPSAIPERELTRIDVCWSVAGALGMVDTIRGAYFQNLHLELALRAGERFRVARALALEAAFSSSAGVPAARRTARFLTEAEALAAELGDAYSEGFVGGVGGVVAVLEGRWRAGIERARAAEEILRTRCVGATWELTTFQFFHVYGLAFTGQMRALARRVPQSLRDAEERGDLYGAAVLGLALANLAWLAGDDAAGARAHVRAAMASWSGEGYQIEHFWELLASGQIDLYTGEPGAARARVREAWPRLERSLLRRVQHLRVEADHLAGRAALATGDLAAARACAARLLAERAPWPRPLGELLQAGIAAHGGDRERAATALRRALAGFVTCDMGLHAHAARHCLGRLLGGDEGRALHAAAEAWMRAEAVVRPEAMVAMLAPGFAGFE